MIQQCAFFSAGRLRDRKELTAVIAEALGREIEAGHGQQLVGAYQHADLAIRRDRQDSAAVITDRAPVIIHPDPLTTRQHKEGIIELAGRDQERRAEAGLHLDRGRREKRVDHGLRLMAEGAGVGDRREQRESCYG